MSVALVLSFTAEFIPDRDRGEPGSASISSASTASSVASRPQEPPVLIFPVLPLIILAALAYLVGQWKCQNSLQNQRGQGVRYHPVLPEHSLDNRPPLYTLKEAFPPRRLHKGRYTGRRF